MSLKDGDYSKLEQRVLAMDKIPMPERGPTTGRPGPTDSTFQKLLVMEDQGREISNPFGMSYGPLVKIVCKPAAAPSCDLVVMIKHKVPTGYDWVEVARYNDMSDDFAHTNAHNRALAERRALIEGELS